MAYEGLDGLPVLELDGAREERFDVAVATWWETTLHLSRSGADRYAYFVQSMEDRFYGPDTAERAAAAMTHALPVAMLTEARWIADQLEELRGPRRGSWSLRSQWHRQVGLRAAGGVERWSRGRRSPAGARRRPSGRAVQGRR